VIYAAYDRIVADQSLSGRDLYAAVMLAVAVKPRRRRTRRVVIPACPCGEPKAPHRRECNRCYFRRYRHPTPTQKLSA
jgi:hypothetical protein